jgi:outer membrane lipoprotein LolB
VFKYLFLLALLMLQTACVTQPQHIVGADAAHSVNELTRWQANGRIGIVTPQQSGSGGFVWQQDQQSSQIQLRGPVGVGSLSVSVDGSLLRLLASDGTYYDADIAVQQMQDQLGADLPIVQLRYWIMGMAAPGEHQWSDDQQNELEQQGWHISYQQWTQRHALRLPIKLVLTRNEVRIVLVIQTWSISA